MAKKCTCRSFLPLVLFLCMMLACLIRLTGVSPKAGFLPWEYSLDVCNVSSVSAINISTRASAKPVTSQIVQNYKNSLFSSAAKIHQINSSRNVNDSEMMDPDCVDLLSFRHHMAKWPPDKPRAVIYFLIQLKDEKRFSKLKKILQQLNNFLLRNYTYPVILFYENNVTVEQRHTLEALVSHSNIYFQRVTFQLPKELKKPVPSKTVCSSHGVGYRHMCRFHMKLVYEEPILNNLDYAWRLDDDSELTATVNMDPFKYMHDNQYLYGYYIKRHESKSCTMYLKTNVTNYLHSHNIIPHDKKWDDSHAYYNNFEISSMKLWHSQEYRQFINFIDSLGGVYYYRWGDAPVKSMAVRIFVPPNKIVQFKELIKYKHQGH